MRRKIREKLERMGVALGVQPATPLAGGSLGFADICVMQFITGESKSVIEVAQMFGMSDDWALKTFFTKDIPGVFRVGRALRIANDALKAEIRSLLQL
jgi:hypothetical protein